MLYLIGQIALLLGIATLVGIALGWWVCSLHATQSAIDSIPLALDSFDMRNRLEQCHRDNANLRRDLKDAQDQVSQLQAHLRMPSDQQDVLKRLTLAEERSNALLQDLQWRDDTIAALKQELLKLRSQT